MTLGNELELQVVHLLSGCGNGTFEKARGGSQWEHACKALSRKPGTWKRLSDMGTVGVDLHGSKGPVAAALFLLVFVGVIKLLCFQASQGLAFITHSEHKHCLSIL